MIYKEILACRACGNKNLKTIIDLGNMALTGVFPAPGETVDSCPLEMVKCLGNGADDACGLVQLRHTYDLEKLYGDTYGYRSGLNTSMVRHLEGIVEGIEARIELQNHDLVIDIASNDGTLLGAYNNQHLQLVGIDPSAEKFKEFYRSGIIRFPEFFSSAAIKQKFDQKAKVITSIAVFYDLEDPLKFMRDVKEVLAQDGLWILEQSYLPTMIDQTSYDTICHEHLEYYALAQIEWMAKRVGLKIIDVDFNNTNGGSFIVTMAHDSAPYKPNEEKIQSILQKEKDRGFDDWAIYEEFTKKTEKHKQDLIAFISDLKSQGKKVLGYGASTKGNVILQYCGFTSADFPCIAEVNEYKFGRLTPGTSIPILSEEDAKKLHPDYLLVLPWHFKENIIQREQTYLSQGGRLLFPLPKIEIV